MGIQRSLQSEFGHKGIYELVEALAIITRLASALDYVHARGIIHRDIKPSNILFDEEGAAYLSDFGIASFTTVGGDESTLSRLTQAGKIVGTPAYMSPEQISERYEITGQSDIYSLGAVLFEMLSGRVPYESESLIQQAFKHVHDPVPSILELRPDLPVEIQHIIERAMAKDPANRYTKASALAIDLEKVVAGRTRVESRATIISDSYLPPSTNVVQEDGDSRSLAGTQLPKARVRWALLIMGAATLVLLLVGGILQGAIESTTTATSTPNPVMASTSSIMVSSPAPATVVPTSEPLVTVANIPPPPPVTVDVMATPGSSVTRSLITATPYDSDEQTYTIQAEDNLFRVGLRYGCTGRELAEYNGIANMTIIYPGQVIRIPPDCRQED